MSFLLGLRVTFQPQVPSCHQVAPKSQLQLWGLCGGLRGFGSPTWHPPSLSGLGPTAAACLPSALTAGTLGPKPAGSAGPMRPAFPWLGPSTAKTRKGKKWEPRAEAAACPSPSGRDHLAGFPISAHSQSLPASAVSSQIDQPLKNSTSIPIALCSLQSVFNVFYASPQDAGLTSQTEGSSKLTGPRSHS